jgi:hypothetical protein
MIIDRERPKTSPLDSNGAIWHLDYFLLGLVPPSLFGLSES